MEILPIDLTALIPAILGISIVLVPVIGLTARFALKPVVEALGRNSDNRTLTDTVQVLQRRLELQEREIEALQTTVEQLRETADFDRELLDAADRVKLPRPEGSSGDT
jgi:hypothetical protein